MAGAPKGNTNALKHGLYARHFLDDQRTGLKRMEWDDFRHEEFLHRVIAEGIFEILNDLLTGYKPDIDQVIKLANSLAICTLAAGTHARTHACLNGSAVPLDEAFSGALDDVPFDLPDDGT
jgi:hypothetical protein